MQHHVKQKSPYFDSLVWSVYEYGIDWYRTCWIQFAGADGVVGEET